MEKINAFLKDPATAELYGKLALAAFLASWLVIMAIAVAL